MIKKKALVLPTDTGKDCEVLCGHYDEDIGFIAGTVSGSFLVYRNKDNEPDPDEFKVIDIKIDDNTCIRSKEVLFIDYYAKYIYAVLLDGVVIRTSVDLSSSETLYKSKNAIRIKHLKELHILLIGTVEGSVIVYNTTSKKEKEELIVEAPVNAIDYNRNINQICVLTDSTLFIYDIYSYQLIEKIDILSSAATYCLFTPDGYSILVSTLESIIQIVDTVELKVVNGIYLGIGEIYSLTSGAQYTSFYACDLNGCLAEISDNFQVRRSGKVETNAIVTSVIGNPKTDTIFIVSDKVHVASFKERAGA